MPPFFMACSSPVEFSHYLWPLKPELARKSAFSSVIITFSVQLHSLPVSITITITTVASIICSFLRSRLPYSPPLSFQAPPASKNPCRNHLHPQLLQQTNQHHEARILFPSCRGRSVACRPWRLYIYLLEASRDWHPGWRGHR